MFLVSDWFWTRPFLLIATHPLRISPFPLPSEKRVFFSYPYPPEIFQRSKVPTQRLPSEITFKTLQKFSSIGRGGGYSMEGGIPYERDGDLCQKIRILLNPLKANNLASYIIFWPISPKQYHYGLKLYWHSVLDTLSEVKISTHLMSLLYGIAPPSSHSWSEYSILVCSGYIVLLQFSFIRSSSISKLVNDLKAVINTPKRYPLFREVR